MGSYILQVRAIKDLGDHFFKVMTPEQDHLSFYQVGGVSRDKSNSRCLTGCLEMSTTTAKEVDG